MKLRLKKTQLESETQPVVKALGGTQEALWIQLPVLAALNHKHIK